MSQAVGGHLDNEKRQDKLKELFNEDVTALPNKTVVVADIVLEAGDKLFNLDKHVKERRCVVHHLLELVLVLSLLLHLDENCYDKHMPKVLLNNHFNEVCKA